MSAAADPIAAVYDAHTALDEAVKSGDASRITSAQPQYQQIIQSVADAKASSNDSVKQLAADFLPKFIHHYADIQEQAIERQLDLIEDDSTLVRIRAIRGIELLCKNLPAQCQRIAEILSQLLVAEDAHELAAVKHTLSALCTIDLSASLNALFAQATMVDAESQSKTVEFLLHLIEQKKQQLLTSDTLRPVVEQGLYTLLTTVNALPTTQLDATIKLYQSFLPKGANKYTDDERSTRMQAITNTQFPVPTGTFSPSDEAQVERYTQTVKFVNGQHAVDKAPYIQYTTQQVLPHLEEVTDAALKQQLLKSFAFLARNSTPATARQALPTSFSLLTQYLPSGDKTKAETTTNFGIVETLLYTFHHFASKAGNDATRTTCGLFTATGQPSDTLSSDLQAKRDQFIKQLEHLKALRGEFSIKAKAQHDSLLTQLKAKDLDAEKKKTLQQQFNTAQTAMHVADNLKQLLEPLLKKEPQFAIDPKHQLGKSNKPKPTTPSKPAAGGNQQSAQKGKQQQQQNQNTKPQQPNAGNKRKSLDNEKSQPQWDQPNKPRRTDGFNRQKGVKSENVKSENGSQPQRVKQEQRNGGNSQSRKGNQRR